MPTSSAAIRIHFLSVIDPTPNSNGKIKCFLEPKNHQANLYVWSRSHDPVQIYQILRETKVLRKGLQVNKLKKKYIYI